MSNWTEDDKTAGHHAVEGLQEAIEEFRNPPDKMLA